MGCRTANRSALGYWMAVQSRGCGDRVLAGHPGDGCCSAVDSPVAAAGRGAAAGGSQGARPRASASQGRRGPLQLAAEVREGCGPGWPCPCCRGRRTGRAASGWCWAAETPWCSSGGRVGSRPRGRTPGRVAGPAVGCSRASGVGSGPGSLVRRSGPARSHRWALFLWLEL